VFTPLTVLSGSRIAAMHSLFHGNEKNPPVKRECKYHPDREALPI
jgi:hypothetical protein